VRFLRNVFPLLDLGYDRTHCVEFLHERGFGDTVKSACIGCLFHGNAGWRWIRDHDPQGWAEAIAFDHAIRHGHPRATRQGQTQRGQYFLHRSCLPLDQGRPRRAPGVTRQAPPPPGVTTDAQNGVDEDGEPDGCSPWSCRSGDPVTPTADRHEDERAA
jgi:hypothetical protein